MGLVPLGERRGRFAMAQENFGIRDRFGEWRPGLVQTAPMFVWPPRPIQFLKWLFGYEGYLLPWQVTYVAIAVVTWLFLTPLGTRYMQPIERRATKLAARSRRISRMRGRRAATARSGCRSTVRRSPMPASGRMRTIKITSLTLGGPDDEHHTRTKHRSGTC